MIRLFRRREMPRSFDDVVKEAILNLPWYRDLDASEQAWSRMYIEAITKELMAA